LDIKKYEDKNKDDKWWNGLNRIGSY
jgi:hypothetical protein